MNNIDICSRYLFSVVPNPTKERNPFLAHAIETTIALAHGTDSHSATIICSVQHAFKSTMSTVLSQKTLAALLKGKTPKIHDVFIKLETTTTMNKTMLATTVLCLFADEKMLKKSMLEKI